MTIQEMVDDLETRLRLLFIKAGLEEMPFTPDERLLFLNKSQRCVCTELAIYYIREIETKESAQALGASGEVDLGSLDPAVLEGETGIIGIKHSGGKWCFLLNDANRRLLENRSASFSSSAPVYYFEGKNLYVEPYSGYTADILYKRLPIPMAFKSRLQNDASSPASTTKFIGAAAQDLSTVNDFYNGAVVYSYQFDSKHVVTAYNGTTREFTVAPAASGNFTDGNYFDFPIDEFDVGSDVNCALNATVQDLIVDWGVGIALEYADEPNLSLAKITGVMRQIHRMNNSYKPIRPLELGIPGVKKARGLNIFNLGS